jgi:hypothetical protein
MEVTYMALRAEEMPPFEVLLLPQFSEAEQIVNDALEYSGINPDTAPVRYAAAEKAARYATYVALGITGHQPLRETAKKHLTGRQWRQRHREIDAIARFEAHADEARIRGEA